MSLIEFIKTKDPSFSWNWHHIVICNQIDEWLTSKDNNNLMILSPPNSSKSTICTQYLPLYLKSHHLYHDISRVLVINRTEDIANKNHRSFLRHMSDINCPDFGLSFVGVGNNITGSSYDIMIIDDPNIMYSNKKVLDSVNNWYKNTLMTRTKLTTKQLFVSTYIKDGLVDYIINEKRQDARQWTVIRIPTIIQPIVFDLNRPEQSYWEDRYSVEYLRTIRKTSSPDNWNMLYQQQF